MSEKATPVPVARVEMFGDGYADNDEGGKRAYVPFSVFAKCPRCGEDNELIGEYLSYPTWGKPIALEWTCGECDDDTPVYVTTIVVRVKYSVSDEDAQPIAAFDESRADRRRQYACAALTGQMVAQPSHLDPKDSFQEAGTDHVLTRAQIVARRAFMYADAMIDEEEREP